MTAVVAAIGTAAVVGAGASIYAANKSAGAVKDATNASISNQDSEYQQARTDEAPFRTTGVSATNQLAKLYGLDYQDNNGNTVKGTGKADFSSFSTSPDYSFSLGQGQDAINRSAAAKGGLLSGAAVKAGETYASGLADQNFQQYVGNLQGLAGAGQTATNTTTAAGTNMANNNSNALVSAGNARASAYGSAGTTIGNSANTLAGNFMLYKYLNPATPASAPLGP